MSQENVEVVRRQFQALTHRFLDAAAAFWHPDIDWRATEGAADDVGVMKGHDALRRYYKDWFDAFDELRAEVEEVICDDDDRVAVSLIRLRRRQPVPTECCAAGPLSPAGDHPSRELALSRRGGR